MKKILHWLDINFEAFIGMIAFFGMLFLITMQIVLRNVTGTGTEWGEEICRFCYVWVCYIGLGYATRNNLHIQIDAVRRNLPEKAQKILILFTELVMLFVFCRFFVGTLNNVIRVHTMNFRADSINISSNWMYAAGPVGYGLGIIRCIQGLIWKFRRFNCSMEVFSDPRGILSGSLETYCYDDAIRAEEREKVSEEAFREAAEFKAAHSRKR